MNFTKTYFSISLGFLVISLSSCTSGGNHIGYWLSADSTFSVLLTPDNKIIIDNSKDKKEPIVSNYVINPDSELNPIPISIYSNNLPGNKSDSSAIIQSSLMFITQQEIYLELTKDVKAVLKKTKPPKPYDSSFKGVIFSLGSLACKILPPKNNYYKEDFGFFSGFFHGLFYMVSFILNLLGYEFNLFVRNDNTWYWIGYILGISPVLGVGRR